jgi:hypothetical protein
VGEEVWVYAKRGGWYPGIVLELGRKYVRVSVVSQHRIGRDKFVERNVMPEALRRRHEYFELKGERPTGNIGITDK